MAFQPFGYRFEVRSHLSPEEAKAAIRTHKQVLFDAVSGPRGWLIGPFVCLWMYDFLRTGPMLIGRIQQREGGSRIRGRAGSDLNGTAYMAVLGALLPIIAFQIVRQGDPAAFKSALYFLVPSAVLLVLIFLSAHRDRAEADPLVDFLERTLRPRRAGRR